MNYCNFSFFFIATCINFNTFPAHGEGSIYKDTARKQGLGDFFTRIWFLHEGLRYAGLTEIYLYIDDILYNNLDTIYATNRNSSSSRSKREAQPKACTTSQFECKNNRCVPSKVVCDGVRNCLDGSDEIWETCQSRYPNSCLLPEIPQEINYNVNCESSSAVKIFSSSKGDFVHELTLLSLSCNSGSTLNGRLQSVCLKGTWTPPLSGCIKTCDPVPKMNNAKIKCYVNNEEVDCAGKHSPGTAIRPQCKTDLSPNVEEVVCDGSGRWNVDEFNCWGCGAKIEEDPPFQYPWNVAIYLTEFSVLVCAGTIVSPNTVVTSASCFDEEMLKTPTNYVVVVGKKKRDFHSIDGEFQKNYTIHKIHIHPNYQTNGNTSDIAIIELKDNIAYNTAVYAACVDWDNTHKIFIGTNTIGHVANYIVNEALGTAKHRYFWLDNFETYINSNMDLNYIPQNSGLLKEEVFKRAKVHPGEDMFYGRKQKILEGTGMVDKGTGYFIEHQNKYYLKGTASSMFGPWTTIIVFTDVLKQSNWAKPIINAAKSLQSQVPQIAAGKKNAETIAENEVFTYDSLRIECSNGDIKMEFTNGCTLPNKGFYNIDYNLQCPNDVFQSYCNHSLDGAPVPQSTTLEYKCKNKYYSYASKASSDSICFKGSWQPPISQCGRICNPLKPKNVILKCTYKGREINCNSELFVNTEVVSACTPEYRNNDTTNSGSIRIRCGSDGEWSGSLMNCVPICGRPSRAKITPTIHGGEKVILGEFPWHAAVYEKPKNHTLICGATIISSYALLSAAHCFYDLVDLYERNPADYEIGVSKIARDRFKKDSETTQFYEVEGLIFNGFQGLRLRFQRDIVIIVTKTKISFNAQVSPICLFQDSNMMIANNAMLDVAGWGVDESGNLTGSPILKVTHLPYISFDECIKVAPASVTGYLVAEKFCSGLNAPTLDQGDSGGGLVLKSSVDFSYYLVGIVSFRATEGNAISLNTHVLHYLPWINTKLSQINVVKH